MSGQATTSLVPPDASFLPGQGDRLESLNTTLRDIANTNIPVLLVGESGTGKDVYARLLHQLSDRSAFPFRKLSCSVLEPEELLRIIHPALTSDSSAPPVGTLFLDGIDELDSACQRALLSMLPENQTQVGGLGSEIFPRLVCSSSRDPEELVERGALRKELYFRINGTCLRMPPLRERKEDIREFFEHFLQKHAQQLKRKIPPFDEKTIEQLKAYDWPGNIRQLENFSRQAVALGNLDSLLGDLRSSRQIPISLPSVEGHAPLKHAAKAASKKAERELILRALERTRWNRKQAARDLQISYKSLLYKIKQIEAIRGKYEG